MEYPDELWSGWLPFPDTNISGNLAPVVEDCVSQSQERRQSKASRKHARSSVNSLSPPSKKRQVRFCCEPCGSQYTQKRALTRHCHTAQHRRNVGLPPGAKYACNVCEKAFSRDHDRVRHENEAHRGHKRSTRHDTAASNEDPRLQQAPASHFGLNCVLEQSFTIEDDVHPEKTSWDSLSTTIEVYPGLADLPPRVACTESKSQDIQASRCSHARKHGAAVSETPPTADIDHGESQDRNSLSWFAESSDDEDGPEGTFSIQPKVNSRSSTAADSAIDMSEDQHEPKRPSITTIDYREQQQEEKIAVSVEPVEKELDSFSKMTLQPRPRMTVIQKQGRATTIPPTKPLLCVFCDKHFEEDHHNLLAHLRQHLDMFRGDRSSTCVTCKIGFVHKADLDRHLLSANIVRHCGFSFDHKHACTGHHRPQKDHLIAEVSDADRFRLCVQLRDWEQSQLRAYIAEVEEVVAKRNARASACYSIEALFRRSRSSFSSVAVSVNTFGSAPCDVAQKGHMGANGLTTQKAPMDIGGLKQRLKMMSLKDSTSHMRHAAKKFPHALRSGSLDRSLYFAATSGNLPQIEELVKLGGLPNAVVGGRSVLSAAADTDTVRLLIGLGANVESQCGTHGSALAVAAHAGRLAIVKVLLDFGAQIDRLGGKYGSALGAAVAGGHIEVARLLLDRGADADAGKGSLGCPLSIAAKSGSTSWVRLLLDFDADVDRSGGDEGSPLGFAVWHGQYDIVRQLVVNGANVNTLSAKRGSPLCAATLKIARREGNVRMVRLLLELGADANLRKRKSTPLGIAASHADVEAMAEVVKVLVANGADVNGNGPAGNPLRLAKLRRQYWMDKKLYLLENTTINDGIDEIIGYTYEVIRLLKEAGANDM